MEHSKGKLVVVYTGEVALGAGFEIDRAKSPIRCFQMICNTADKNHQDYHVPKINANAQRLVKCWNEYDKNQERIQLLHDNLIIIRTELNKKTKSHDELVEALEKIRKVNADFFGKNSYDIKVKIDNIAHDVLAKAKA